MIKSHRMTLRINGNVYVILLKHIFVAEQNYIDGKPAHECKRLWYRLNKVTDQIIVIFWLRAMCGYLRTRKPII